MDGELERYHKTNSGLDLVISNLKLKQTGLSGEVTQQRQQRTDLEALIKRMQHDVQQVGAAAAAAAAAAHALRSVSVCEGVWVYGCPGGVGGGLCTAVATCSCLPRLLLTSMGCRCALCALTLGMRGPWLCVGAAVCGGSARGAVQQCVRAQGCVRLWLPAWRV